MYPFAIIEEIIYSNKKEAVCSVSKQAIKTGDAVYAFKHKNYNDVKFVYAKKEIADANEDFIKNKQLFDIRAYDIKPLADKYWGYEDINYIMYNYANDYEKGLQFLQNPMMHTHRFPYYYPNPDKKTLKSKYEDVSELYPPQLILDKTIDQALRNYFEEITADQQWDFSRENDSIRKKLYAKEKALRNTELGCENALLLLSVWLLTPIHKKLLQDWEGFTNEFKILLSLSNIEAFKQNVVHKMGIPEWDKLLAALFNQKFTLTEMEYIMQWSKTNKQYLPLLSSVLHQYEIHFFNHKPCLDFSEYSTDDVATRFIYLFINEPQYLPVLERYIANNQRPFDIYASGYLYMECHYYRAAIFYHIQNNNTNKATILLAAMPNEVKYYYKGSPKTFINDTVKWAKQITRYSIPKAFGIEQRESY
jgi:hypothetical protein